MIRLRVTTTIKFASSGSCVDSGIASFATARSVFLKVCFLRKVVIAYAHSGAVRPFSGCGRCRVWEVGTMEKHRLPDRASRLAKVQCFVILVLFSLASGCTSSSGGAFGSNDPGATGTVVSGKSDTAGLSAGAAFTAPPTATKSP